MNKDITRRQFLKRFFSIFTTTAVASSLGYIYARYIEPKYLEVSHHSFSHPMIPKNFNNIKIVQFSDTHIGHYFDLDDFEKVITKVNSLKPDIVFFTGDLVDEPNKYPKLSEIPPLLKRIEAPLGKFFIYGNHDHGGYGSDIYRNIMKMAEFDMLLNSSTILTLDGEEIFVAGLDDVMLGKPDYASTFKNIPPNKFLIVLVHEPDVAPITEELGGHLQLSGHSHGGQIQLPFYGPIITPPFSSVYNDGYYNIGPTNMGLFVNRGIGTTRLPLRFLSRPEISVYTLKAT